MNTHYSITPLKPGNRLLFADTLEAAREKALANRCGAVVHDANDALCALCFEGVMYAVTAMGVETEVAK